MRGTSIARGGVGGGGGGGGGGGECIYNAHFVCFVHACDNAHSGIATHNNLPLPERSAWKWFHQYTSSVVGFSCAAFYQF